MKEEKTTPLRQRMIEDMLSTDVQSTKDHYAIPTSLRSCHTGFIAGYLMEGHVPPADIIRLL
jgi:hypothetical protein